MKRLVVTLVVLLIVFAAVILGVAYGGFVNVAATHDDLPGVRWFLETTQDRSIEAHAERAVETGEIQVPDLTEGHLLSDGLVHYHETCASCHGAPGFKRTDIGEGLNPRPPELAHEAEEEDAAEIFWVAKYGVRMTGMPAFGGSHSDDELWAMVAFIKQLPQLSASDYAERVRAAGLTLSVGGHHHGDEAGGDHGHSDDEEVAGDHEHEDDEASGEAHDHHRH